MSTIPSPASTRKHTYNSVWLRWFSEAKVQYHITINLTEFQLTDSKASYSHLKAYILLLGPFTVSWKQTGKVHVDTRAGYWHPLTSHRVLFSAGSAKSCKPLCGCVDWISMDFIELNDQLVYVFSVYDSPGFQLQNLSVQKPMLYLAVSCNCSWALSIEGFNPSHWNLANVKDDIAG